VSEHLDFLTNLLLCPTSWCSLYKSSVGGVGRGDQARSKSRGFKDPQESPSVQVLVLGVKKGF